MFLGERYRTSTPDKPQWCSLHSDQGDFEQFVFFSSFSQLPLVLTVPPVGCGSSCVMECRHYPGYCGSQYTTDLLSRSQVLQWDTLHTFATDKKLNTSFLFSINMYLFPMISHWSPSLNTRLHFCHLVDVPLRSALQLIFIQKGFKGLSQGPSVRWWTHNLPIRSPTP